MQRHLTVFLLPCFLAGCVSVVLSNRNVPQNQVLTKKDVPVFFDVARTPAPITCKASENKGSYRSCEFSFHSWQNYGSRRNDHIKGKIYIPKNPKGEQCFLIIPGSGENVSSSAIADTLANAGFYVVRIYAGFRPLTGIVIRGAFEKSDAEAAIKHLSAFFRDSIKQRVVDLMRIADFMEATYGVKKIHTVGVSLGGGVGALFAAVDPRGESLMMAISSASTARLFMDMVSRRNPPTDQLKEIKELIYKKFALTYDQAFDLLKRELEAVEPLTYKDRLSGDKILIVSGALDMFGLFDSVISYSATLETWEAYGKPEWITLSTGHITSGLAFSPLWLEFPYLHHFFYTTYQSYLDHLIKDHFLPKALK